jgi:hypothetical protein
MDDNPDYNNLLNERKQGSETLAMCSLCKGFFSKKIIYRHKKICVAGESTSDYPATCSVRLFRSNPAFSNSYRQEILECFQNTKIGKLIRADEWIQRYGYFSYKNFEGSEKKMEKRASLMANLRQLAHLYLEFKKVLATVDPPITSESCSEMFNRDAVELVQDAIINMTTRDDNTVKDALKKNMRYLIQDVCKVMRANYLLSKEDDKADEMSKFLTIMQTVWPSFFAASEEACLKKRQSHLRRPERLLLEEDLAKLRDYSKEAMEQLASDVYEIMEYNKYSQLRDAVVCRLTLFNARRGGEPSRLTLKEWNDALSEAWIDSGKVQLIEDAIEKKLLCETKIAYIHASKVAKLVPLLIPKDCWKAMSILTDVDVRRGADINVKNKFAFPNTKHSLNHATGWICVSKMCKKAGLERSINATDMRHYVSTVYSLLDASPLDREMFFKHLGHSKNINENVYQCPPALKTIMTVGKFFNSLEGNIGKWMNVFSYHLECLSLVSVKSNINI